MIGIYLSILDTEEDRIEFEKIYNEYRDRMYHIAYSILHNEADAEDAVQEAFFRLANNFKKLTAKSSPKISTSIVIIIRSTSIDIYRKNKTQSKYTEAIENLEDNEINVSVDFFEEYNNNVVRKAIRELPDYYRDTMFLYFAEKIAAKDIAIFLGTTLDAVYKRIQRGKAMLKSILEKEGFHG